MEWLAFLKCYFGIMIPYYSIIILYDLFVGAKKIRPLDETEISYDVKDLLEGTEPTQQIGPRQDEKFPEDNSNAKEQQNLEKPVLHEEQLPSDSGTYSKEGSDSQITFKQPPQGQGIPLAEFIETAKAISRGIEF